MVSPIKIFSIIQEYNTIQANQTIYLHLDLVIGIMSLAGISYTVPIFYRFMKYTIRNYIK